MKSILPIADLTLAEQLKQMGFSEPVFNRYQDGVLVELDDVFSHRNFNEASNTNSVSAPFLQEVQVWLSMKRRMDVLVYREIFFDQTGGYYAIVIRRKDNMTRETRKFGSYHLALEAGIKTAVMLLSKKRKRNGRKTSSHKKSKR